MKIPLRDDEIAYLSGWRGTLALVRTLGHSFYLDKEEEEIVIFTDDHDLLVASTFEVGEKARRGLKCTLFLIREMSSPLIVLRKGHPASSRLKIVVSVGERTRIRCDVQPGTHPEQDVLCGTRDLEGVEILSAPGGAEVKNFTGEVMTEKLL
ncbi:hypothetical protein [Candidatus Methanocrinis natronophilus]|uniref:Uncharacterized protein n=1 Tax=Candidatus Methanocrinis natronophilus TaxID=3033396 RepID=A0ABT5X770_9EURY|nr:hypothetical protein [Candidatus Methanocrinis natronophilus]MDF0590516.1 hypothetical protein [Candidatus Methanocrinis natronophilus]